MNQIYSSILKVHKYCEKNNYKGYSLYDSHTSPIPFNILGHKVSFLINQVVKRSPLNLRTLMGVQKTYNPKGIGLFLYSYVIHKRIGNPLNIENLDKKINFFIDWLILNPSKGYKGQCWGYHYPWPKSDGLLVPANTPNSVVTAFNVRAVFEYYLLSKDEKCLNVIEGAKDFILNDIGRTENEKGICFAYTPVKKDMTINANLLAAEVLACSDYVSGKNRYKNIIEKVLDFTMAHQNKDGSWYYSFNPNTGKPKKQIDFHQGYVLETIKRICDISDIDICKYDDKIKLGLVFYKKNQFSDNGVSYWRLPKKWPVDIHNQSQGIITFSIFKEYDSSYLKFSQKIAEWTIKNMQDSKGNFYYQKWPFLMNKVSYMRWGQGWMMLALSKLLEDMKR